jgi:hypothetical protein
MIRSSCDYPSRQTPPPHDYTVHEGGLVGIWLPLAEGAMLQDSEALIADWLAGWRNEPSFNGPALAIVESGHPRLTGQVGWAIAVSRQWGLPTASLRTSAVTVTRRRRALFAR